MNDHWTQVKASTFADPADIAAFRKAKARGLTDREAFAFGDNGIGCWGDLTTADRPMVALPPEDWKAFGAQARGKRVLIRRGSLEIEAELRDTMPARRNIKNGCGIDLNPAAAAAFGYRPPATFQVEWKWKPDPIKPDTIASEGGGIRRENPGWLQALIKILTGRRS